MSSNICDIINDVKLFATRQHISQIHRRKFLTLSNQTSGYNSKCIEMSVNYVFYKYSNALHTTFTMVANNMNPDQTAPHGAV